MARGMSMGKDIDMGMGMGMGLLTEAFAAVDRPQFKYMQRTWKCYLAAPYYRAGACYYFRLAWGVSNNYYIRYIALKLCSHQ